MPNPLVQQGTLNRLRGSVVFADNQSLNVTAPFLAREAIHVTFDGDSGMLIPTLTGGVTSPEPYQIGNVTINLLKSQNMADLYKHQIETDVNVGDFSIIGDSPALGDYEFVNGILLGVRDIVFDGNVPGFVVNLRGIYYINQTLFDLT